MSGLIAKGLRVRLGGREVLGGVDFSARPGEITGLAGPNGAGKSTLLKAILGLTPSDGEAFCFGRALDRMSRKERARTVSYLPQIPEVHWPMTARAVVSLGRYPYGRPFQGKTADDEAAITRALRAVDGAHLAERSVLELSAGERARVLLARALAVEAKVLLADEPVAALDPAHQLKVMQVLKRLAADGLAVAVVLHDLTLASRFCDTLTLLNRGRVVDSGKPGAVLDSKNLEKIYKIRAVFGKRGGQRYLVPWDITG